MLADNSNIEPITRMQAWVDMTLMFLTFFLSIIYNIEVGVISSLVISLLLVVHRSSKTRMEILVSSPDLVILLRTSVLY